MQNNKALFISDLHGIRYAYERAFDIALQRGIGTFIFGGDLTPKRVAIKLMEHPSYDDAGNECAQSPGEVMPLSLLEPSKDGLCLDALRRAVSLNKNFHPAEIEMDSIESGCLIYRSDCPSEGLDDMIAEYGVLEKLSRFFGCDGATGNLELNELEMFCLDDITRIMRAVEDELSPEARRSMEEKLSIRLRTLSHSEARFAFPELAPSRVIPLFARYGGNVREIRELGRRLKETAGQQEGAAKELFLDELSRLTIVASHAAGLVGAYNTILFTAALKKTTLEQLKDKAESAAFKIRGQKEFVNGFFTEKLLELKRRNPAARVFAILGNDDRAELDYDMRNLHERGLLNYVSCAAAELANGIYIAGCPYVRPSGMFYPGWEKQEHEIRAELEEIAALSPPERTVYVCHTPPYGGELDMSFDSQHIGSRALAEFIAQRSPMAVLSGHCHESFRKTGFVMEKRGSTFCFNPGGDHNRDSIRALIVDLTNPSDYQVIQ